MTKNEKLLQLLILSLKENSESMADTKLNELYRLLKINRDKLLDKINKIYADYSVDGVLTIKSSDKKKILSDLMDVVKIQAKSIGTSENTMTDGLLKHVYQETYFQTAFVLSTGVSKLKFDMYLDEKLIEKIVMEKVAGSNYSDRIWTNKEKLATRIQSDIKDILKGNTTIDKASKRIKDTYDVTARESKRLVQNEVTRVYSAARDTMYRGSNVVKQLLFDATLDGLTSKICQRLDGTYYDVDNAISIPGQTHVSCRSVLVPVVDGWSPSTKRENIKNIDGEKPIIDYKQYQDWKNSLLKR